MSDENVHCPYARTVTPGDTYVKHGFSLTDGFAEVKRDGNVLLTLTDATAEFVGEGKNRTGRVVGTNGNGEIEVWSVVCSCGCNEIPRIFATEEMYVPT